MALGFRNICHVFCFIIFMYIQNGNSVKQTPNVFSNDSEQSLRKMQFTYFLYVTALLGLESMFVMYHLCASSCSIIKLSVWLYNLDEQHGQEGWERSWRINLMISNFPNFVELHVGNLANTKKEPLVLLLIRVYSKVWLEREATIFLSCKEENEWQRKLIESKCCPANRRDVLI